MTLSVAIAKRKTILNSVTFQTTTINFVIYIWFVSWAKVELYVTNFSPFFLLSSGNYDSWLEWNKFPSTATTISSHSAASHSKLLFFLQWNPRRNRQNIFLFTLRHASSSSSWRYIWRGWMKWHNKWIQITLSWARAHPWKINMLLKRFTMATRNYCSSKLHVSKGYSKGVSELKQMKCLVSSHPFVKQQVLLTTKTENKEEKDYLMIKETTKNFIFSINFELQL